MPSYKIVRFHFLKVCVKKVLRVYRNGGSVASPTTFSTLSFNADAVSLSVLLLRYSDCLNALITNSQNIDFLLVMEKILAFQI